MTNYKEIVTKAVTSKHKKSTIDNVLIETEQTPNTILGCWVINHSFKGSNSGGDININGSYDINVWYSYDNDTKTNTILKKYNYSDTMNMPNKLKSDNELIVNCLKQPTATDVKIENGVISLKIEKDMGVTVIGSTTVKVATDDSYDDYEEIIETEEEKELDINVDDIDENYLTVNK